MPRTKYPRLKALTNIPQAIGFGAGLATGLTQTIPYGLEYFPARQQAITQELSRLTMKQMDALTEQTKALAQLNVAELKEIGDIIQKNVFLRPAPPGQGDPLLKQITGGDYKSLPADEIITGLKSRKFEPDVIAINTSALMPYYQMMGLNVRIGEKELESLLKILEAKGKNIARKASVIKSMGGFTIFPIQEWSIIQQLAPLAAESDKIADWLDIFLDIKLGIYGLDKKIQQKQQQKQQEQKYIEHSGKGTNG